MSCIPKLIIFIVLLKQEAALKLKAPKGLDNEVLTASEVYIRRTFDKIFHTLGVKLNQTLKYQQRESIQNCLWSLTHQDFNNLQEVVKVAQVVDKDEINSNFMDAINEVVQEHIKTSENEILHIEKPLGIIDDYINDLNYLKKYFKEEMERNILNELILQGYMDQELNKNEHNFKPSSYDIYRSNFKEERSRRIYAGKQTAIRFFPFVAAVQVFNQFYCAGSIISSDLVITAASCLQLAWNNSLLRESPSFITVRVGSSNHASGGKLFTVQQMYFHPGFNTLTLNDNLCILKLVEHINLEEDEDAVQKISVDHDAKPLPPSVEGVAIIGWGATTQETGSKLPDKLSYATIDVFKFSDCQEIYSKAYVREEHFCAGYTSKGGGACSNDVGDPALVQGVLTGIVSFGSPTCGASDAPTVFSKLGYYKDWINGIMKNQTSTTQKSQKPYATARGITQAIVFSSSEYKDSEKFHGIEKKTFEEITTQTKVTKTASSTTAESTTPVLSLPVENALKTYFGNDEDTYRAFLKTCQAKDIKLFGELLSASKSSPIKNEITHFVSDDKSIEIPLIEDMIKFFKGSTEPSAETSKLIPKIHERTKNKNKKSGSKELTKSKGTKETHRHHDTHHTNNQKQKHHLKKNIKDHKSHKKVVDIKSDDDTSKSHSNEMKLLYDLTTTTTTTQQPKLFRYEILDMAKKFLNELKLQKFDEEESIEIVDKIIQTLKNKDTNENEIADIFKLLNIPTKIEYTQAKREDQKSGDIEKLLNSLVISGKADESRENGKSTTTTTSTALPKLKDLNEHQSGNIFSKALKYMMQFT